MTPAGDFHNIAARLRREFEGTFSVETIERYLTDSLGYLDNARIKGYVLLLAEQFARARLKALGQAEGVMLKDVPEVLFVCVYNAGNH